jgi:antitoxin ParD1/3/4
MVTVRKTITLTGPQDAWINSHVDAGNYTNDSEYIREQRSKWFARR